MTYYILTIKRFTNKEITTKQNLDVAYKHVKKCLGDHMTPIHFRKCPKKVHELDKHNRLHHHSLFLWTGGRTFRYTSCKIPGYRIHFKKVTDPIQSFPKIIEYLRKQICNKYEQEEIYFDNLAAHKYLFQ